MDIISSRLENAVRQFSFFTFEEGRGDGVVDDELFN
jgi:hypothetical protein